MSLLASLRKKQSERVATATPATFATDEGENGRTVASVATVAVANPTNAKTASRMNADDEQTIRAWLALIAETDPATIAEVLSQCQQDAEARDYFICKSRVELRQGKVVAKLRANPELDHVSETHDDVEPEAAILTLAIRGKGVCELRIPKSRYDAFALLKLIEKHTARVTLQ